MKNKALVAIFMVGIMISSSFLIVSATREPSTLTIENSSFRVINETGNNQNLLHYTMYVPGNPFTVSVIKQELGARGIDPKIGANLWTFSVPIAYQSNVNDFLGNISAQYNISFFSSVNNSIAYPAIQSSSNPQTSSIPFAYTPTLIARAYNFTWALNHGINGKGQTIVIVDAYGDPNLAYDVKAFDAVNGLPPVNLTISYPYGTPGQYNATWAMETATDVEWAHALAPGANIVLLISAAAYTNYLQQVVSYAIQNRLGGILSLSWGTPESQLTSSAAVTYSSVYKQAASEGMDVFAASGDKGAYLGTSQLTVSFPASDPWVTSVGGTSLYVLNNQFHQYGWGGLNNGVSYGSGGGYSSYFSTPYWQQAKGYNGTTRGVPDVAMDADKYTGVYVISNGGQYTIGGTSVSTPMWADVAALLREYTNTSLPSINPLLYQIARSSQYTNAFSQIYTGTNGYYNNTPGWNPVTGLGTPQVSNLLNDSRSLLSGYGVRDLFNGINNYNATSVRASLNLRIDPGNLDMNGTTFYYIGFYGGNYSSVKFGILLNSTGESMMMQMSQDNTTVTRHFIMPGKYGGNLSGFQLEVTYSGSSLYLSTSGGFTSAIPVFLDYSGEMVPYAGVKQLDSETNLTMINAAGFSSIETADNSTWYNVTQIEAQQYSAFNSQEYSTIVSSYSGNSLSFLSSGVQKSSLIYGSGQVTPEIIYNLGFGNPLKATFSLTGTASSISFSVNGSKLSGSLFDVPLNGGNFTVNASFRNSNGVLSNLTRTIFLPGIIESNMSLNYSIPGYAKIPTTTVTTMWFYSHQYSPNSQFTVINSTNEISIGSAGFYRNNMVYTPPGNLSVSMVPIPLNITVFVFNVNSTVKIGNSVVTGHKGYFYREISPTMSLSLNVSSPGFMDSNYSYAVGPGNNLSVQISLEPVDLNASLITGTVSDYIYSFPIQGAVVKLIGYTSSYTNITGNYILFAETGKYSVNATAPLYESYSSPLNVTSNTLLNIQLRPSKIAVQTSAPVNITHYFPLLFYFGFISWNDYKGGNFSIYQIYVAKQPDFLNPTITTISSQNTSYTFLTGLVPGHTYYISIVLRLTNSQVYQSQIVKISYSDPVYLTINLLLTGAIVFYGYIAYTIFRKKK